MNFEEFDFFIISSVIISTFNLKMFVSYVDDIRRQYLQFGKKLARHARTIKVYLFSFAGIHSARFCDNLICEFPCQSLPFLSFTFFSLCVWTLHHVWFNKKKSCGFKFIDPGTDVSATFIHSFFHSFSCFASTGLLFLAFLPLGCVCSVFVILLAYIV